jgi:phospholipase C
MSATLDPAGTNGGPILSTSSSRTDRFGTLSWTTMPEQLQARGISWKVYGSPDGNFGDNVLPYFKQYQTNPTLAANALTPTFPGTFQADVTAGTLPQVSWVLAPLISSEHPPAPEIYGESVASQVLSALVSNKKLWAKTALIITYDENGGFFDHVPPPTAPAGTPDEYLTVSPLPPDASGVAGPIGLGFRVPTLVVSPFSRGGFVCSDVFDHTSTLRFLEARFGVKAPNLTAWRRKVVGDLTATLGPTADMSKPDLPAVSPPSARDLAYAATIAPGELGVTPSTPTYPPPSRQQMPRQEPGRRRRRGR